tara:strand:- start:611 stop:820 length:210 start_codon:yes stop_codon:yes gene_type:complete
MSYIKIEGHEGYVKDEHSGAVLNTNKEEIEAARKRKADRLNRDKEFVDLKNEVSDIKKMLTKIVEKLDG